MKVIHAASISLLAIVASSSSLEARTFFELSNQRFQDGGRSGLASDEVFKFNGPLFIFDEPDYLGSMSGLVDRNADGPTIWARALGGYDSNPVGFKASDGAWFGGVQLGASENFTVGPQRVFLGGSARVVQFGGDIFRGGRDGNDDAIFDLDLRLGLQRFFNQSVSLTTFHDLNIGGYRRFGEPYLLPGINRQDDLLWRAASQLQYRFDGVPLDDPGLQLTTALRGMLIKGLENDDRDVQRSELRQSVNYIASPEFVAGAEGRIGFNAWDAWEDLDSSSYLLLATAGGQLTSGIYYHLAAGWEWWAYEKDGLYPDRDDFHAELKISGELSEQFYVAGGLTYGIDTVRPARMVDSADPMGLKAALTGVWHNETYTVAGLLTYTWYEADLVGNADGHWDRWSAGISVDRNLGDNSRVGISFEYAGIDTHRDDFEDIESVVRWVLDL